MSVRVSVCVCVCVCVQTTLAFFTPLNEEEDKEEEDVPSVMHAPFLAACLALSHPLAPVKRTLRDV